MTAPGAPRWWPRRATRALPWVLPVVMPVVLPVLVVVALAGSTACGAAGPPEPLPTASIQAGPAAAAPATAGVDSGTPALPSGPPAFETAPEAVEVPSNAAPASRAVTIALAGDIHTEGPAAVVATTGLGEISDLLSAADVAVVNLETAIVTSSGAVAEPKTYTFKTNPSVLAGLAASGVDVASMANNHGMDYGRVGLADSLAAIADNPVPRVTGIGATAAEAWAPYVTEAGGRTIGVISATDVLESASWVAVGDVGGLASAKNDQQETLIAATGALAEQVDISVVFLHWGKELEVCPTDRQLALAERLVEAGADIVAGSHAHVVQPVETLNGASGHSATVAYGLGNFAWYHSREPSSITGVLTVTIQPDDTQRTSWQPARIGSGVPVPEGDPVTVPVTGCA